MKTISVVLLLCSLMYLTGCAKNPERARAMQELQSKAKSTVPICKTNEQCLRMMDAAELWLVDHSKMRIRDITRNRIATYSSLKSSSTTWFYTVTKRPYKEGNKIVLDIGVRNFISQVSDRDEMLERKVAFNNEIGSIE